MQVPEAAPLRRREADRCERADAAKIQKISGGRSWPRSAAIVAVAAGSSPTTTAPWLAGAVVSA